MTTENTQPEKNDTQVTVVEESFASSPPANAETSAVDRATTHDAPALPVPETYSPGVRIPTANETASLPAVRQSEQHDIAAPAMSEETGESRASEAPLASEDAVRPFTSFIEEFRLAEGRQEMLLQKQQDQQGEQAEPTRSGDEAEQAPLPPMFIASTDEGEKGEGAKEVPAQEEAAIITPTIPAERPVSPLLRPSTRIRMPRHGGGRQRETFATHVAQEKLTAQTNADVDEPTKAEKPIEAVGSGEPMPEAAPAEQQEQPRPARRYRFDRPNTQPQQFPAASSMPTRSASVTPSPARIEENPDTRVAPRAENEQGDEREGREKENTQSQPATSRIMEQQSARAAVSPVSPATPTENESLTTPVQTQERHRRHGRERQRAKTQPTTQPAANEDVRSSAPTPIVATPTVEEASPVVEPEGAINRAPTSFETPIEDLPPLEYSELQAASSRRRRRRRTNSSASKASPAAPEQPQDAINRVAPSPASPLTPTTIPSRGVAVPASPYTIQSGYTVSQMNQGNDLKGPFMGPEPSPARGSISSTPSRMVRPIRNGNEAQRIMAPTHPAGREGSPVVSPGSINHLANVIAQAIQTQSDRMIAELRHANQAPTNISVALPPFPSTERVGVFVDVANLLYSARTLRTTIDFGKLLDFLRGNRRLVRAHAYCPTSPQPGDDQMFLQAVKGLGYRITTKNYKTFASGAKKADMDLDLCMDVVRLVDGKAVDCIVLVSGDSDFMPMLDYCSDHGVRVEVAAFDESMSATLRQSCDLFINLSMLDEIRV